jgi:hypothetical protein
VRRRAFITLIGGAAAAWSLAVGAQQAAKVPRIGFLFYGSPGPAPEIDAFRQGLHEHGYIEGQNIAVEYRYAGGQVEQLPELAAELVADSSRTSWEVRKVPISRLPDFADGGSTAALAICCFGTVNIMACRRT